MTDQASSLADELGPFADPAATTLDRRVFGDVLDAIGQAGSLDLLPTPALICDLEALRTNVETMQDRCSEVDFSLRPHAKSHKTAFVTDLQMSAGAVGVSCTKIAEVEAIFDAYDRIDVAPPPVLITSPFVGDVAIRRVADLARRGFVSVAVDDLGVIEPLAHALDDESTVDVVIDVDTMGRTGVTSITEADELATAVETFGNLTLAGLQAYAGHVQHIADKDERVEANKRAMDLARDIISAQAAKNRPLELRTGGGTGSHYIDPGARVLNEIQPGSYVFMDREYRDALGGNSGYQQSLFVLSRVISAHRANQVTVDAGFKALATDAGDPVISGSDELRYRFFGDEHGMVTTQDQPPALGSRIRIVPAHCDPTVNLYDHLWLYVGDTVVGVAPIIGRGRGY